MPTFIIHENSPLPFVQEHEEELDDQFERIPGLPYTKEERIASVRRSMEDIRAGRVFSAEEVRAMFPRP